MKHPHAVLVQPSKHPPPASIHVEARSTWTSRATNKLKPPSARSTWRSNHIWIDNAQSKLVGAKPCKFGAKQKIMFWVFVACLDNSSLGLSSTASSQITEACTHTYIYIYIHTHIYIYRCVYIYKIYLSWSHESTDICIFSIFLGVGRTSLKGICQGTVSQLPGCFFCTVSHHYWVITQHHCWFHWGPSF